MTKDRQALPRGIVALGVVSLLMDVSSEMIHGLLPAFWVTVLGGSVAALGLLEGVAEATVLVLKVFSGPLSDWLGRRKPLVLLGYTIGAFCKPLFALAQSPGFLFGARTLDRVGKGIRGAPRDALVADLAPSHLRGRAFGLRQSLDTVGAFLGPLLAILLMTVFKENFRFVFWLAAIPAFLAVFALYAGVSEGPKKEKAKGPPLHWTELKTFGGKFWFAALVGGIFQLARFSEAFLILRVQQLGLSIKLAPLVLVVMNIVYAATAYPVGKASDSKGRSQMLLLGMVLLLCANLVFLPNLGPAVAFIGVILWGLHLGFTQGILAALVVDTSPRDRRGLAFGVFNLVSAAALLLASSLAGLLWTSIGSQAVFIAGAILCAMSLVGFGLQRRARA